MGMFCNCWAIAKDNQIGLVFTLGFTVIIPFICLIIQLVCLYITINDNNKIAQFKFINEDVNDYGIAAQIIFMIVMVCGFILTTVIGILLMCSPCIYSVMRNQ